MLVETFTGGSYKSVLLQVCSVLGVSSPESDAGPPAPVSVVTTVSMRDLAKALTAMTAAFLVGGGTLTTSSCATCSVKGQTPLLYEDGHTNASRTMYQSGLPDEEMLHFPRGRIYQFVHGLGTTPASVDVFVSFREQLTDGGDSTDKTAPNNVAPSAGNQAVIEAWDDEVIQVRNDTCEDQFYLRVVAWSDPDATTLGGADSE